MNELPPVLIAVVRDVFRAQAVIFLLVDKVLNLARHPCRLIEFEVFAHAPEQSVLVFRIEYLERLWQTGFMPVTAQQSVRQPVEGTDP